MIMEALRSKHSVDKKAAGSSVVGPKLPQSERRVEIVPGVYVGREFTIPEVSSEDQSLSFRAKHLGENKDTAHDSPDMSPEAQMARYQAAMGNKSGVPSEDQKQTPEASAKIEKTPKKRRSAKSVVPQASVSAQDAMPVEKAKQTFENEATRAWRNAEKFGRTIRTGDPFNREAADAWDTADRLGIIVESDDLLARMEKEGQLIDHTKDINIGVRPVVAPENPVATPTLSPVEPTDGKPDEVPLNPVITTEQKQAWREAPPPLTQPTPSAKPAITPTGPATIKEIPQTEAKASKTEAEKAEEYIAQIEKEIAEKIAGTKGFGGVALNGGEKQSLARDIYLRELGYSIQHEPGFKGEFGRFFAFLSKKEKVRVVDNNVEGEDGKPLVKKIAKVNWAHQYPGQELVEYLRGELETKVRKGKEEVALQQMSELTQGPTSPDVTKVEVTEAEEVSSEDLRDSARQYDDYLVALKYTPERGGDGLMRLRSNEKGDNEKGEYAIDKETGKPFEFEKFSEANKFLKKKLEQKNAPQNLTEMMEDKTPAEKTKEEVLV